MILPEGHEDMTDDELAEALVTDGVYDEDAAAGVVFMLRHAEDDEAPPPE